MGRINEIARRIVPAMAVMIALTGASPAFANSSANADIAAPLRAAQSAKPSPLGNGDQEFRELFSNWQSLDKPQPLVQPINQPRRKSLAAGQVSIPSRIPVAGVRLSSNYGMRNHPTLGTRRKHNGVDLAVPSVTSGIVTLNLFHLRQLLFQRPCRVSERWFELHDGLK